MATLTITAADLELVEATNAGQAPIAFLRVGQATNIGQLLYFDEADQKHKLADTTSQAKANALVMALTKASADGDYVYGFKPGNTEIILETGASSTTVGQSFFVSSTAGAMEPEADLSSTDWKTQTAVMLNTTGRISLLFRPFNVQQP